MKNRKDKYIDNTLVASFQGDNLFGDVYIEHNSFPNMKFEDIDTKSYFFEKEISFPMIISPMTGGTEKGMDINNNLFQIAKDLKLPLGIGSQDDLENPENAKMYLGIVDDDSKEGISVLSNVNIGANVEEAELSMKLINADGFYVSLNAAQEAVSYDYPKDFTFAEENLRSLSESFPNKVIVKEKGMGMSKETVQKIVDMNIKYIDVSGFGGTNIIEMENLRNYRNDFSELFSWGIPTAKSILNARSVSKDIKIIASGGLKTGVEIAKALIIGADYVSIGGELMKHVLHGGYNQGKRYLEELIFKTKIVMFLLGAKNIEELKKVDYKIVGRLKEIL